MATPLQSEVDEIIAAISSSRERSDGTHLLYAYLRGNAPRPESPLLARVGDFVRNWMTALKGQQDQQRQQRKRTRVSDAVVPLVPRDPLHPPHAFGERDGLCSCSQSCTCIANVNCMQRKSILCCSCTRCKILLAAVSTFGSAGADDEGSDELYVKTDGSCPPNVLDVLVLLKVRLSSVSGPAAVGAAPAAAPGAAAAHAAPEAEAEAAKACTLQRLQIFPHVNAMLQAIKKGVIVDGIQIQKSQMGTMNVGGTTYTTVPGMVLVRQSAVDEMLRGKYNGPAFIRAARNKLSNTGTIGVEVNSGSDVPTVTGQPCCYVISVTARYVVRHSVAEDRDGDKAFTLLTCSCNCKESRFHAENIWPQLVQSLGTGTDVTDDKISISEAKKKLINAQFKEVQTTDGSIFLVAPCFHAKLVAISSEFIDLLDVTKEHEERCRRRRDEELRDREEERLQVLQDDAKRKADEDERRIRRDQERAAGKAKKLNDKLRQDAEAAGVKAYRSVMNELERQFELSSSAILLRGFEEWCKNNVDGIDGVLKAEAARAAAAELVKTKTAAPDVEPVQDARPPRNATPAPVAEPPPPHEPNLPQVEPIPQGDGIAAAPPVPQTPLVVQIRFHVFKDLQRALYYVLESTKGVPPDVSKVKIVTMVKGGGLHCSGRGHTNIRNCACRIKVTEVCSVDGEPGEATLSDDTDSNEEEKKPWQPYLQRKFDHLHPDYPAVPTELRPPIPTCICPEGHHNHAQDHGQFRCFAKCSCGRDWSLDQFSRATSSTTKIFFPTSVGHAQLLYVHSRKVISVDFCEDLTYSFPHSSLTHQ
jgi:hypothetical protein